MSITTELLLDTTVYGTASGNYDGSSQDFHGNGVTAANYYGGHGSVQTVTIQVTGFIGIITLQATLDDSLGAAKWFDVYTYGDGITEYTETHPANIIGNFVWMRARVTGFDAGTINSILIAY